MRRRTRQKVWKRLATEAVNPRSAKLDRVGIARVVALMQSEDRRVLAALKRARPSIVLAAEAFRETFRGGGRCWLFGAGTSGRLAVLEAAELPPTFGTSPKSVQAVIAGGRGAVFRAREGAEDRYEDGFERANRSRPGDLVIGVSASSVTPFVRGALDRARQHGAETVLVTASRSPGIEKNARILVRLDTGPEVVAGSTRLKAGTATKLALNQITTSALASSGKVFGPWMVDLRAGSAKLKDRAERIVAAATESSPNRARTLLARAGGEVKTAIVMGRARASAPEARRRLEEADGDLRKALVGRL
ncbi:MAG TPA: N-acetylmuramic acid 6-phosphate etherase [Thermoanaerobaculia bacterium]|nr:N-acetylmuramic acid 6-phosphate etherase [Thermoanaerobaculia bacterium]